MTLPTLSVFPTTTSDGILTKPAGADASRLSLHFSLNAWVLFIVVTVANAVVWAVKSRRFICEKPDLPPGYRRMLSGWLLFGSLPWIIMGLGIVVGSVPLMFHFLEARNAPWVIAWLATVVIDGWSP